MSWRIWRTVLGAGALLAAGLSGCQRASPPAVQYHMEEWAYNRNEGRRLTTEHYEIYTTLRDEGLLATLPELMEKAYGYYQSIVPPARPIAERMPVYVFATREDWVAYTRDFTGPRAPQFLPIRNGGYSERGVTVIQYTAHQTTFPIMAHEGWHQYLHHCVNEQVPAWLNEGLAVVCEGQVWNGPRIERFDPWYNPVRRNTLAEALLRERLFPLRELLETHAGNIIALPNQAVGTYYAQLWGLMLFLQEGAGGRYADGFRRMIASLTAEQPEQYARAAFVSAKGAEFNLGRELFRSFISSDIEALEEEYWQFLRERMAGQRPGP